MKVVNLTSRVARLESRFNGRGRIRRFADPTAESEARQR
jgi:hypothetical protein